jgi:hypothetical protein
MGPRKSLKLALASIFAAIIALGTILSIPLPAPLYEITWSPAIFLALAVLADNWTAVTATAVGSFIGELYNISFKGGGSPIYPFGMIWARAPEILIVAWGAKKGGRWLVASMVIATVYETLAFFFPDWLFYNYALFQYQVSSGSTALGLAAFDFGTLLDLAWIPVAFALIYGAGPAFRRLGFKSNLQEPARK